MQPPFPRRPGGFFYAFIAGLISTVAQASPDFTPDLNNARTQISQIGSAANTKQFISDQFGTIDTSQVASIGASGFDQSAHAQANVEKIAACQSAAAKNYQGLTGAQKVECIAIITAAGNMTSRNPYLDPENPSNRQIQSESRQVSMQQSSAASAPASASLFISPPVSSTSNCTNVPVTLPPVHTTDMCHVEKPVEEKDCTIPISITIDATGSVVSTEDRAACKILDKKPECEVGDPAACDKHDDFVVGVDDSGTPIICEHGDDDCIQLAQGCGAVVDPNAPPCVPRDTNTVNLCVEKKSAYACWQTGQAWDDSRCGMLESNSSCTPGEYQATRTAGTSGIAVWADWLFNCEIIPPAASTTPNNTCQTSICIGGTCMSATSSQSPDFGGMATGMEALRESGVYAHSPTVVLPKYCTIYPEGPGCDAQVSSNPTCPGDVAAFMDTCRAPGGCDAAQMNSYLTQYPQCNTGALTCPKFLRDFLSSCEDPSGCDQTLKARYLDQYPQCNYPDPPEALPGNLKIFQGIANSCTRPTGPGIGANCCNSSSGNTMLSNQSVLGSIGFHIAGSAIMSAGRYGAQAASNYMYDFMFESGGWMREKALDAFTSGMWDPANSFNMSVGAFGVTLSTGTASSAGFLVNISTKVFGADSAVTSSLSLLGPAGNMGSYTLGDYTLAFNPYALALSVAVQVVVELYTCDPDEKLLATRRGGDLCEKTGEHCSADIPIVHICLQMTEDWCCWNSRLAKLIAVQGGAQLGLGTACGGFTPAQLASIDFSKIDFSNFMRDILDSTSLPDGTYLSSTVQQGINQGQAGLAAAKNAPPITSAPLDQNMVNYATGRVQMMLTK